jgi:hypothetical protein
MTLLLMDGFDYYTGVQGSRGKWISVGLGMTTGRFGVGQSNQMTGVGTGGVPSTLQSKNFGNQSTLILGFAFNAASFTSNAAILMQFMDDTTTQVELRVDATGHLFVTRNGTTLGSPSTNALLLNTWYYIEIKVVFHQTAGSVEVRVAETVWVSTTGVDTCNTANQFANNIFNVIGANLAGHSFDDLYLCNAAGSGANNFLGDCRIETLYPTGAGTYAEWTPSAGTNFGAVDEATANDDTDYVSSSTVGQRDTHATGNLVTATGTVRAIQPVLTARLGTAGARTLASLIRTAGNDVAGADLPILSSNYLQYTGLQELNPDTGVAWTIAEINAAEFGMKVIA